MFATATVFLGGGRITSALIAGLRLAGYQPPILVHDRHPQKLRKLCHLYHVATENNLARAVAQAKFLVIAVRPGSVRELLRDIGATRRPMTAVSLAAGISLRNLKSILGPPVRWARAMPSPVCRNANGLTALAFERGFPPKRRAEVRQLFAQVGEVLEIPERSFDVFTATYSSSHGYHALATLAAAAEKLGLDRKSALTAGAHALADAIAHWRTGGLTLRSLLYEAATPGGIAATAMSAMDAAGYGRAIEQGLRAGVARAKKLQKVPNRRQ